MKFILAFLISTSFLISFAFAASINRQQLLQVDREDVIAPLYASQEGQVIFDEYIVMLRENVVHSVQDITSFILHVCADADIFKLYQDGFAARLTDQELAAVRARPEVAFVEYNQVVSIYDVQMNPPSWGLPRIDQKEFNVTNEYVYPSSAGEGVDVYVIDTGVFIQHADFEGRAKWGYTANVADGDTDGNGHGTHVAGTIAGKTFGVAKKANIIAVKVLGSSGSGTLADVIDGIQWAASTASQSGRKSAANMSLGSGRSAALDLAVTKAIASGLSFAVAAGNGNQDACRHSPAAVEQAVTVGASTQEDSKAFFSNYGRCVDIMAPGLYITSAWIGNITAKSTISGTSMAAPHVAGVMALYLAEQDYTPAELKAQLQQLSFKNVLTGLPAATVNYLLNNNAVPVSKNVQIDNEKDVLFW